MDTIVRCVVVVSVGYLLGSLPVAVLVAKRHQVDPRRVGDRNPGYWNVQQTLGRRAALPVFVGDVAKGAAAGIVGRLVGGPWWIVFVAVAAAMVGHAWPVFAGFRGGRSILTFVGGIMVAIPGPAALGVGMCVIVSLVTRRFAWGARSAMFGLPLIQAFFTPRASVAATGALLSIIGLRFAQAAHAHKVESR